MKKAVQLLAYLLIYPLLWAISVLPFRLLYLISDGVYVLLYHIIGYRKKVVRANLLLAFPEKSGAERRDIERKFYHHLCDTFLEMIKTMNISRREIDARFTYENIEVYHHLENLGKPIAMMVAHYASYEWIISMSHHVRYNSFAIYKKIANPYFDKLVHKIRTRFKATMVATKDTGRTILYNKVHGIPAVYGFASDQSPKLDKAHHWTTFFGIKTPVHTGAEMLSKKFDMSMIFVDVQKVKRGYYRTSFEILTENPKEIPDYEITDIFMKKVEEQIRKAPEFYLWTHKRWKHRA